MSKEKTKYDGEKINVEWDGRLCIHIGECGYSEGELFVGGRDPWCKPDLASVDDVVDAVGYGDSIDHDIVLNLGSGALEDIA